MTPGRIQVTVKGFWGAYDLACAAEITMVVFETGDSMTILVHAEHTLGAGRHAFRATVTKVRKHIILMRPGR